MNALRTVLAVLCNSERRYPPGRNRFTVRIKEILWLDELYREAIMTVTDSVFDAVCFTCPFEYVVHLEISVPLNWLNVERAFLMTCAA